MEYFRTFAEDGKPGPLVERGEVHRLGLWHKSVQVLVFNDAKEMLIQHRADDKDLYAGLWDFSVGEHLQPDEADDLGALRGLREELGVTGVSVRRLGDPMSITCRGDNYLDREIQQSFYAVSNGPFKPDDVEVQAVRFIGKSELSEWIAQTPELFTPWFLEQWSARLEWAESRHLFK